MDQFDDEQQAVDYETDTEYQYLTTINEDLTNQTLHLPDNIISYQLVHLPLL